MHLKFLTRSIKHFQATNSTGEGGRRCLLHLGERGSMVVLFCKKLPQLWEIRLFIREKNEPMMAIRGGPSHN